MAKVKFEPGEEVLKEEHLPYLKNRLKLIQGTGYLTNRRFVHTNNMAHMARAGLVGSLIGEMTKGKVDIEVPLGSVARISKDVHGRNKIVLKLETVEGEEFRLMPPDFDDWLQAFNTALWALHQVQLAEIASGVWDATRA